MSDANRISGAEQAAKDAVAAAQKKVKAKNTQESATQQKTAQGKNPDGTKALKSAFDEVLDTMTEPSTPLVTPQNKFDSALREIQRDDSQSSDQDSDEGDEKEPKAKDKGEKSAGAKDGRGGIRGRVAGKQTLKGQGEGSSGGRGEQGSEKGAQQQLRGSEGGKGMPMAGPAPSPFMATQQAGRVQAPENLPQPRELPKAVLDQIVQSVTISRKNELQKEIEIDFRDNFFNGLKLKVSAHGDEISIEFIVPNRDVEATFKNEKDKIALALGEKNVDVRAIRVTMR